MSLSKKDRERLLKEHCGAINEDDAIDARHYFYNKKKSDKKFRKAFQLCRQVADTLHMTLSEGDELLEGLVVIDVVPAPDSRRMLVLVGLAAGVEVNSASEVDAMMSCLEANVPRLRAEIARSITRKKTPQLVFEFAKVL